MLFVFNLVAKFSLKRDLKKDHLVYICLAFSHRYTLTCLHILQICANWFGFFDPESGIARYQIGVGTQPGLTDIHELSTERHHSHYTCLTLNVNSTLVHDNVYYIIVWATNSAIIQKNVSAVSNGGIVAMYSAFKKNKNN